MEMFCSSIPTLLGNGHQNLHETYQCRMYSGRPLMMGKEDAPKHVDFYRSSILTLLGSGRQKPA